MAVPKGLSKMEGVEVLWSHFLTKAGSLLSAEVGDSGSWGCRLVQAQRGSGLWREGCGHTGVLLPLP